MVYITGDIHGQPRRVVNFAKDVHISRNDTLIILGDVGANYYLTELDNECKRLLNSLKCTVFCMPSTTVQFVLRYIMVLDVRTITVMIEDIDRALVDEQLPYRDTWLTLKFALEDRLQKIQAEGGNKNG